MRVDRFTLILAACCVGIVTAPAIAHPGHGANGFVAGLVHPLSGVDHLMTMLAIGVWAAQLGKRAVWLMPATFVAFMLIGAGLAFGGMRIGGSAVDQIMAALLLVLGLLIATAWRLPVIGGVALSALFAIFHGYAHGAEFQGGMSAASYALGFIGVTTGLLATGVAMGAFLKQIRHRSFIRLAGLSFIAIALLLLGGLP